MKDGHGDKLEFLGNYASADVQENKKPNPQKKKKKPQNLVTITYKETKKLIVELYNTHKNLLLPLILQSIPPT